VQMYLGTNVYISKNLHSIHHPKIQLPNSPNPQKYTSEKSRLTNSTSSPTQPQ
jgi:hypothetical protein